MKEAADTATIEELRRQRDYLLGDLTMISCKAVNDESKEYAEEVRKTILTVAQSDDDQPGHMGIPTGVIRKYGQVQA